MVQRMIGLAILAASATASAAPKAKVTILKPTVTGSLDAKAIAAVAQRTQGKLLACYQKALARDANLSGNVVLTFSIGGDGKPADLYASGSPEVRDCVSDALGKLGYAKPKDSKAAAVAIVVMFENGLEKVALGSLTAGSEPEPPIDHGEGHGVGYGQSGIGHNKTSVPTVSIGQPNAQGDLDKAIIRRYIKRNIQKIQYCYEKNLLEKPGLAGSVMVEFDIGKDGKVVSSKGSGLDKVDDCVADVIKGIEFPEPKGGGTVRVNYPFLFKPAD